MGDWEVDLGKVPMSLEGVAAIVLLFLIIFGLSSGPPR